jgi:hypothetical protein
VMFGREINLVVGRLYVFRSVCKFNKRNGRVCVFLGYCERYVDHGVSAKIRYIDTGRVGFQDPFYLCEK